MIDLFDDYKEYSSLFHKIKPKYGNPQLFNLRTYQSRFVDVVSRINGPKRVIVLKPRQAGFTTLGGSYFSWLMATRHNFRMIGLADQNARTLEMVDIYETFLINLPPEVKPMISVNNTERIVLDNPKKGS